MAQAGNQLGAPNASVWPAMGKVSPRGPPPQVCTDPSHPRGWGVPCHVMPSHNVPCHATLRHAKPCHIKQCRAMLCHAAGQAMPRHAGQALVQVRSPEEAKGRGSAGRRSPRLGGGISAVCVQSHRRLGPGALWRQEGAEQAGRVFKPIGSRRSRQGRGKGAACLVIALINQARSEQDPTLSTLR